MARSKKEAKEKENVAVGTLDKLKGICDIRRGTTGDTLIFGARGQHKIKLNRLVSGMEEPELARLLERVLAIRAGKPDPETQAGNGNNGEKKTERPSVLKVESRPCECGCGAMTRRGSRFLPGHDAKLKSRLRKAAAEGDAQARKELIARGWEKANVTAQES